MTLVAGLYQGEEIPARGSNEDPEHFQTILLQLTDVYIYDV
jgi:hypothetical protein